MGTNGYFTDDYEPYEDQVIQAYALPFSNIHMEYIWIKLADFCNGNIQEFRLISFSLLSASLFLLCGILHIEYKYFICYYSLICLNSHLCWIRQPLAIVIFLIGTAFIIRKQIIIAIPFLFGSLFLHKTSIIFLLLLICAWIPLNRKTIWFYGIMSITFIVSFNLILHLNLPYSAFLLLYLESESEFAYRNIVIVLISTMRTISDFLLVGGTIYHFLRNESKIAQFYIRFIVGLTCVALCLITVPYETGAMIGRLMAMALTCTVLVLSDTIKSNLYKTQYYRISIPLFLKYTLTQTMMLGNNYSRLYRLTRLF